MQFTNGWLAFELGVLRRLKFASVALPFTGEGEISVHLKNWKVRVAANDPMLWSYTKAFALIENNTEQLNERDLNTLLDDAYVPREKIENSALLKWFNETDAWWFDNVRFNAEKLSTYKRALALTIGMMVGDYVLSFDPENRNLREPLSLSRVFNRMRDLLPAPRDNGMRCKASNQGVRAFIAERRHTDLLFLRLPLPSQAQSLPQSNQGWREEWLLGSNDFWEEIEMKQAGRLGSKVQSKRQYLALVEDILHTAAHIPAWAVVHTENGFITSEELAETVGRVRKIDAIYSKDFSDLLGVRAAIITAAG